MNGERLELGAAIRRYREARHMSLRALGRAVGVEHDTIKAWESGRGELTRDRILALAEALGVRPDNWLLLGGFALPGSVDVGVRFVLRAHPLEAIQDALGAGPWHPLVQDAVKVLLEAAEGWEPRTPNP